VLVRKIGCSGAFCMPYKSSKAHARRQATSESSKCLLHGRYFKHQHQCHARGTKLAKDWQDNACSPGNRDSKTTKGLISWHNLAATAIEPFTTRIYSLTTQVGSLRPTRELLDRDPITYTSASNKDHNIINELPYVAATKNLYQKL
jgi:hypothetical protein